MTYWRTLFMTHRPCALTHLYSGKSCEVKSNAICLIAPSLKNSYHFGVGEPSAFFFKNVSTNGFDDQALAKNLVSTKK